jgi:hypothetical protein
LRVKRIVLTVALMILVGIAVGLSYSSAHSDGNGPSEEVRQGSFTITTKPLPSDPNASVGMPMNMEGMTHYDEGVWAEGEFIVPEDMWITGFSSEGSGVAPHNFYVFIQNTKDYWCPENPTAIWSGGTVTAQRPTEFQSPYGVFLKKGTPLLLTAMFPVEAEARDAQGQLTSFSVHAAYEPAAVSERTKKIFLYMITPAPCGISRPIFPVPPHSVNASFTTKNKPFVFPEDGSIILAAAHFHAAYEKGIPNTVQLFLNAAQIDGFTTTDIGNGDERNPQLLKKAAPVTVHAGDKLWMEAIFNNPSNYIVPEGMAIIGFYFSPKKNSP